MEGTIGTYFVFLTSVNVWYIGFHWLVGLQCHRSFPQVECCTFELGYSHEFPTISPLHVLQAKKGVKSTGTTDDSGGGDAASAVDNGGDDGKSVATDAAVAALGNDYGNGSSSDKNNEAYPRVLYSSKDDEEDGDGGEKKQGSEPAPEIGSIQT